mgnify:CR=1 FL=1
MGIAIEIEKNYHTGMFDPIPIAKSKRDLKSIKRSISAAPLGIYSFNEHLHEAVEPPATGSCRCHPIMKY